jgi:Ca2+-binding EF-hand superfamily protein
MAIRSWTSSQHQEFKEAFAYFDDDHDGKISGEQAATVRSNAHHTSSNTDSALTRSSPKPTNTSSNSSSRRLG